MKIREGKERSELFFEGMMNLGGGKKKKKKIKIEMNWIFEIESFSFQKSVSRFL